jgi:hypothetical protein
MLRPSLGSIPIFGLALAKKAVEVDPGCRHALIETGRDNPTCRQFLGSMYGFAILRIGTGDDGRTTCLQTREVEQLAASLRKELESSIDSQVLISAGNTMKGWSSFYHERCGGDAEEAVQVGMKLVRKAIALNPSLIGRVGGLPPQ